LKNIGVSFEGQAARGDAMITREGVEGGAIYALSAALRDAIAASGFALLEIDLRPDQSVGQLTARLAVPRGGQSMTNYLRKAAHLSPVEINLLREAHGVELALTAGGLARAIKAAPIRLAGVRPIERAISTAGGVAFSEVDDDLMLRARPGVFVAGEMLDWEAPTGGYLLQACFATGAAAARVVLKRLAS
jgi:uncharacterized flavoprotein (TIGR03862 family)